MTRKPLVVMSAALAGALSALALVAGYAQAASPPTALQGKVGPDATISMSKGGKKLTKLKAGRYALVVDDRSSAHDFHLRGPGIDRIITGVGFVGSKRISITLKKGVYRFVCDPHSDFMHGSFRVA